MNALPDNTTARKRDDDYPAEWVHIGAIVSKIAAELPIPRVVIAAHVRCVSEGRAAP